MTTLKWKRDIQEINNITSEDLRHLSAEELKHLPAEELNRRIGIADRILRKELARLVPLYAGLGDERARLVRELERRAVR